MSEPAQQPIDPEAYILGPRPAPHLTLVKGTPPESRLELALYMASKGIPVFPLRPGLKDPFGKFTTPEHPLCGGVNIATCDPKIVRQWFKNYPDINYGMALGGRTALDTDAYKGPQWVQEFNQLTGTGIFGHVPATLAVASARGGIHQIFEGEVGCAKYGTTIDIISTDARYVVGPGSIFEGKQYRLLRDLPIAPLPDTIRTELQTKSKQNETGTTDPKTDLDVPMPIVGDALKHVEPRDREHWIGTLGAIKDAYGEEGREVAEEWCAAYAEIISTFDDPGWEYAWGYLKEDCTKRRRVCSILFDARQKGWSSVMHDMADIIDPAAVVETVSEKPAFTAQAYVWVEPAEIAPREWLGRSRHLIRQFASGTIAPGGRGKTSLVVAEILEMVTGRHLLCANPDKEPTAEPLTVYYWNGEDPYVEVQRRIASVCKFYGIKRDEIEGRLFVGTGEDAKIMLACDSKNGVTLNTPLREALIAEMKAKKVDVLTIDPFVRSHAVSENDNVKIDAVCNEFRQIARVGDLAIDLLHHVRKTGGAEVTAEDMRGATALHGALRSLRMINPMTPDEAKKARVRDREVYFRVENGKSNMARPSANARWFELKSVALGNARPKLAGDEVGVVSAWQWPALTAGLPEDALRRAQEALLGGKWRADAQSPQWAGLPIAEALGLDPDDPFAKAHLKQLIAGWTDSGDLIKVAGEDEHRKPKTFLEVPAAP
jgi:hypothetical protein